MGNQIAFANEISKRILNPIFIAANRLPNRELQRFKSVFSDNSWPEKSAISKILGDNTPTMLFFRRFVRYRKQGGGFLLEVSKIPLILKYLDKLETGYDIIVTKKMQRYLAWKGIFLKVGRLKVPARPIFTPAFRKIDKNIEIDLVKLIESELKNA